MAHWAKLPQDESCKALALCIQSSNLGAWYHRCLATLFAWRSSSSMVRHYLWRGTTGSPSAFPTVSRMTGMLSLLLFGSQMTPIISRFILLRLNEVCLTLQDLLPSAQTCSQRTFVLFFQVLFAFRVASSHSTGLLHQGLCGYS